MHDTRANLGSAIARIGVGGMEKLLNLSGLVTGAFLQMRMLNMMIPPIRGTWFSLKQYPDAESRMGREKCRKDTTGEKRCKVFVVNTWSASWRGDVFARTEEDGVCGCWRC